MNQPKSKIIRGSEHARTAGDVVPRINRPQQRRQFQNGWKTEPSSLGKGQHKENGNNITTPERAITSSQTPKRPACQPSRALTRGIYRTLRKTFVLLPREKKKKLQQCCLIQLRNTIATSDAPPQVMRDKRKTRTKRTKIFRRSTLFFIESRIQVSKPI